MARITGLNDLRQDNSNRNNPLQPGADQSDPSNAFLETKPTKNPMEESFSDMLQYNIFSSLKWYSFATILTILLILVFIAQVTFDGLMSDKLSEIFLPVKIDKTFTVVMTTDFDSIKKRLQLWRFFSSLIVHRNAMHLFSNLVSVLIWASLFERIISPWKIPVYFILGGSIGNIIAAAILGKASVFLGVSAGVFGIFGGVLGYLIYNWKNMERYNGRVMWMFMIIFIVVFSLIFSNQNESFIAHMAGFVSGLFVGFCFSDKYLLKNTVDMGMTRYETVFFYIGISVLGLITLIPLFVIFVF